MTELSKIRNFSIIAHIDHGKSTLADRLLEECKAITQREMESQILDSMELEKERGITIKATAATMNYTASDGETYVLNLIDTPGHVDFNYEVSRSMAACEGAILVVDASQGVEAQTLANTYLAIDAGLEVLPVINKIDLPSARPAEVKAEVEDIIGLPAEDSPEISAKNGINIPAVLEMIVRDIPAPEGDREAPLQALIFDSQYDSYRGVIVYTRIVQGTLRAGQDIKMMATGATYKVVEVGTMSPNGLIPTDALGAGEVGYITASTSVYLELYANARSSSNDFALLAPLQSLSTMPQPSSATDAPPSDLEIALAVISSAVIDLKKCTTSRLIFLLRIGMLLLSTLSASLGMNAPSSLENSPSASIF